MDDDDDYEPTMSVFDDGPTAEDIRDYFTCHDAIGGPIDFLRATWPG